MDTLYWGLAKVLRPTRNKIGHDRDVFPSQNILISTDERKLKTTNQRTLRMAKKTSKAT